MTPRLIRFKDAPRYLGMDRHCFNREVRPYIVEIRIGKQGIAFDKVDLDDWISEIKKQAEPKLSKATTELAICDNAQKIPKKSLNQKKLQNTLDFQSFANALLKQPKPR